MSKTANISAQIEDEHNKVIAALIATAVAPPLAQFRETSAKALRDSSKEAIDAAQELIRHTDGVAKNMVGELQTYARQVRDAADGLTDRVGELRAAVETTVARSVAPPIDAATGRLLAAIHELAQAAEAGHKELDTTSRKLGEAHRKAMQSGFADTAGSLRDDHARQTTRVVKELNRECDDIREKLGQSMQHVASLTASSHGKLDARLGQLQKLLQERVDEGLQGVQQRQESTDLSTRGVLAEITAQLAALDARTRTDSFVLAKRIGWAQVVGIATAVMILALFLFGHS